MVKLSAILGRTVSVWILPALGENRVTVLLMQGVTARVVRPDSAWKEPASESLEGLMVSYVEGNQEAFDSLYKILSPRLFGYLLRLTRHREQAEDLVQITFSKIHRARQSYLKGAPLLPWVLAIARRSFLDARRHTSVRPEYLSQDGALPDASAPKDSLDNDVVEALERAMQTLPEPYAEAIQLTKITGLSISEAASVLGLSNTAVKLRIHRGYKILREELATFGRDLLPDEDVS